MSIVYTLSLHWTFSKGKIKFKLQNFLCYIYYYIKLCEDFSSVGSRSSSSGSDIINRQTMHLYLRDKSCTRNFSDISDFHPPPPSLAHTSNNRISSTLLSSWTRIRIEYMCVSCSLILRGPFYYFFNLYIWKHKVLVLQYTRLILKLLILQLKWVVACLCSEISKIENAFFFSHKSRKLFTQYNTIVWPQKC